MKSTVGQFLLHKRSHYVLQSNWHFHSQWNTKWTMVSPWRMHCMHCSILKSIWSNVEQWKNCYCYGICHAVRQSLSYVVSQEKICLIIIDLLNPLTNFWKQFGTIWRAYFYLTNTAPLSLEKLGWLLGDVILWTIPTSLWHLPCCGSWYIGKISQR